MRKGCVIVLNPREILTQILDQHRRELMAISPLALLTADLPAIKIQDLLHGVNPDREIIK